MPRIRSRPECQFCHAPLLRRKIGGKVHLIHPEPNNCPVPERSQHDEVERVDRIVDPDGRAVSPFRAKSPLGRLEEKGVIDPEQLAAGVEFHTRFQGAFLDQLRALDPARPPRHGMVKAPELGERTMHCRDYIWSRITALGGLASLPGSCAWNVIGLEKSLHSWATERALHGSSLNAHEARGILISALTTLAINPSSRIWSVPRSRMHETGASPGWGIPAAASV
jgi:hypothetical protein